MRRTLGLIVIGCGWLVLLAGLPAFADPVVAAAPEEVVPLGPGRTIPSATVRTVAGAAIDLADLTKESGALLVFYRGGW